MSMTDKEIALELTKSFLEHLNSRNLQNPASQSTTVENTVKAFNIFYDSVSKVEDKK